jgi:hypothetical protein
MSYIVGSGCPLQRVGIQNKTFGWMHTKQSKLLNTALLVSQMKKAGRHPSIYDKMSLVE